MRKNYRKIYTIEEIKEKTKGIFAKYQVKKAYIFGSYARGEATEKSDIDIMIVNEGSSIDTLLTFTKFETELEEALRKDVDVVTEESYTIYAQYENKYGKQAKELFFNEIKKDRRILFG